MAKCIVDEASLTGLADDIRAKGGTTEPLVFPDDFRTAINAIQTGCNLVMTTVSTSQASFVSSLTIPELIGAKYFILQGNPAGDTEIGNLNMVDDCGVIHQLLYLNGIVRVYKIDNTRSIGYTSPGNSRQTIHSVIVNDGDIIFDESTGTISADGLFGYFSTFSSDTSTTDIAYTVYRLG